MRRGVFVVAAFVLLMGIVIPVHEVAFLRELSEPVQLCVRNILGETGGNPAALPTGNLEIPAGLRVLVFSPHPDDETLAAGGLIQRVLEDEGKVAVVFMTNGDGYVEGVHLSTGHSKLSKLDFIGYGMKRHGEAVRAISALGVQSPDGLFLGFPDQGINPLWETYWSRLKPYTSPYTRFTYPHYKSCLTHWVKYDGSDLDVEIERVIRSFSPDWIILPDPRDDHPDHAATGVFVLDALRRLDRKNEAPVDDIQVFTYLVHYAGYPLSGDWVGKVAKAGIHGSSIASDVLSGTEWVNLPLNPREVAGKQRALAAYKSQAPVLGGFLKEFLRPSEIFGHLDTERLLEVPREYAVRVKRTHG